MHLILTARASLSWTHVRAAYVRVITACIWDILWTVCNRVCWWALLCHFQTHSVNDEIYISEWRYLEIPVKNCIVGTLLTCPIYADMCFQTVTLLLELRLSWHVWVTHWQCHGPLIRHMTVVWQLCPVIYRKYWQAEWLKRAKLQYLISSSYQAPHRT